jgi:hypothetical protein
MIDDLNESNFEMFAIQHYMNPHCSEMQEFYDDLKRIRYIKRLFKKYHDTGIMKERLVLNHMVVLYNLFESRAMTKMLFLKLESYENYLKPFLILLNYWPMEIGHITGKKIVDSEIPLDKHIIALLRKI